MSELVRWHTLMSLDGFIAGPNDEMGWAFEAELGSGETVDEIVRATGALLVGRRTQDAALGPVAQRICPSLRAVCVRWPAEPLRGSRAQPKATRRSAG